MNWFASTVTPCAKTDAYIAYHLFLIIYKKNTAVAFLFLHIVSTFEQQTFFNLISSIN